MRNEDLGARDKVGIGRCTYTWNVTGTYIYEQRRGYLHFALCLSPVVQVSMVYVHHPD